MLSSDVAEAIKLIVQPLILPTAIDKKSVVRKLVMIANTNEEGAYTEPSVANRRALSDLYFNRLSNSSIFQAGYKRFEEEETYPVVPVTLFFFNSVFVNGDVTEALNAMTEFEIKQSMPRRKGRVPLDANNSEYARDEDGDLLMSGDIAGIVVFPPGSRTALLHGWLARMVGVAQGSLGTTVNRIENSRPNTASVESLKDYAAPMGGRMRRALPRPRQQSEDE